MDISYSQAMKNRLIIIGAGASGLAAAIAAARKGLQVDLIDRRKGVGGTVVHGLIHSLAGFFDLDGNLIDSSLALEFCQRMRGEKRKIGRYWVLNVDPNVYRLKIENWLEELPNIHIYLDTTIEGLELRNQSVVQIQKRGLHITDIVHCEAAQIIDATGNAELIKMAIPSLYQPAEKNSYGLVWRVVVLGKLNADLTSRIRMKTKLEALLPSSLQNRVSLWIDTGLTHNELFIKLNLSEPNDAQICIPIIENRLATLLGSDIELVHGDLCLRSGGRLKAHHQISSHIDSAFFQVAWPFEIWSGHKVELSLPETLPFRLSVNHLRVPGVKNFWATGKSAGIPEPYGSAARVVGCCWAMGEQMIETIVSSNAH